VRTGASYQGLWIFPVCLVAPEFDKSAGEFRTLEEGLRAGTLRVSETGDMGRVLVGNRNGARAVMLEGETLVGGAQNRMINAGAALAPGAETELPSSCVELHRWDCRTGEKDSIPDDKKYFQRSDIVFGSLKRLKLTGSLHSLHSDRRPAVDQQKVWKHIAGQFGVSGAATRTLDLHDLYEFWDAPLRIFSSRFTVARNQVGLISFLDRHTWFADLFLNNDLLFKNFRKLVRAYSFDALIRLEKEYRAPAGAPCLEDARGILKTLRTARLHPCETGPRGSAGNFFFSTARFAGSALLDAGLLVHMTACSL